MSNQSFLIRAGAILLFLVAVSLFLGHPASAARGQVYTIDQGFYDAEQMKQPVPMQENIWSNGTYSNTKANKANVVFDIRDRLTVSSELTITPTQGSWVWYPVNQSGNRLSYTNTRGSVAYEDLDTTLKETIVLNAPVKSIEWKLNLSMKPQSLGFSMDADGYSIRDPANENERIHIPFPYVVDVEGTRRDLTYGWNNGQKLLSLNLDDSGLIYPLVVDPTFTVDTNSETGIWPNMLINASGIPQIAHLESLGTMRLSRNNSGVWTTSNIYTIAASGQYQFPYGAIIDVASDLPVILGPGTSSRNRNITWMSAGKWRAAQIETTTLGANNPFGAPPVIMQGPSGRIISVFRNGTYGPLNITRIEDITGTSTTVYLSNLYTDLSSITGLVISGKANSTTVLNIIWGSAAVANPVLNWTTITDSSTPATNRILLTNLANISTSNIDMRIDPLTDFPSLVYVPLYSAGSDDAGRSVNLSRFNPATGRWEHELVYRNTTSPGMGKIATVGHEYNSSGTPYVVLSELDHTAAGTVVPNSTILYVTHRVSAGVWSTPVQIGSGSLYVPASLAFDTSNNLHVAWWNYANKDLYYYFESFPSAAGVPPIASFTATPEALIRNQTVSIVDQSTNSPTTVELYGSGGNPCVASNISFSPGGAFEIFPKNWGWCSLCEIAANGDGTDTACLSLYVSQPWTVYW